MSVVELDDESREEGAHLNRAARAIYLECMTTGQWPGYAPVHPISIFRRLQGYQHDRHPPSTDVTLPSDNRPPTLSQQIVRAQDQFAMAAPRGIEITTRPRCTDRTAAEP